MTVFFAMFQCVFPHSCEMLPSLFVPLQVLLLPWKSLLSTHLPFVSPETWSPQWVLELLITPVMLELFELVSFLKMSFLMITYWQNFLTYSYFLSQEQPSVSCWLCPRRWKTFINFCKPPFPTIIFTQLSHILVFINYHLNSIMKQQHLLFHSGAIW